MSSDSLPVRLSRSTIFRATALYIVLLAIAMITLGLFVEWHVDRSMNAQTNAHIDSEIESLAELYGMRGARGLVDSIDQRLARVPDRASIYLLLDARDNWLAGNLSSWPEQSADANGWIEFELHNKSLGASTKARVRPFRLRSGMKLLVGRDIGHIELTRESIRQALIWGVSVTCAIGILVGIFMSRGVWRKLNGITQTSKQVIAGDLSQRVVTKGGDSDLDSVSESLNAMLDEIQRLMTGVEQVTDNIAHDLRTPLARLRNRIQNLAVPAGDPASERQIQQCISDVDDLTATFNALLKIGRLESGANLPNVAYERLDIVVQEAVDLYEPIANEKQIELVLANAPATAPCDPKLVKQAICNLIDNAIKFSASESLIHIALREQSDHIIIEVSDSGIGMSKPEHQHACDRFFRADKARHTPGNGLGLSMVKAICTYHRAELTLTDNLPGVVAKIKLPQHYSLKRAA